MNNFTLMLLSISLISKVPKPSRLKDTMNPPFSIGAIEVTFKFSSPSLKLGMVYSFTYDFKRSSESLAGSSSENIFGLIISNQKNLFFDGCQTGPSPSLHD